LTRCCQARYEKECVCERERESVGLASEGEQRH
jgi:hypothetical protein